MAQATKLNYINVGPQGTFKPSGDLQTTSADIDEIFTHLAANNADKLTVHFHGGLIDEGSGFEIADKMTPLYLEAGAHPVTFIWETGLLETIWRNLQEIHETALFQKLVKYAIRHAAKRLGGNIAGKGAGEAMSMTEIEQELANAELFDQYDNAARGGAAKFVEADLEYMEDEISTELQAEFTADEEFGELAEEAFDSSDHLAPSVERDLNAQGGRGPALFKIAIVLAKVTYRILKRYVRQRDHGFYPTVIEEVLREFYLADLGSWVWSGMKDVAQEMWLPNGGPLTEDSHPGAYFLEKLAQHQNAHPGFSVDTVGHSAGSIAICHMFRSAAERGTALKIRNVLFLAPACTSKLFHDEIVTHPERFDRFRMFTMDDEYEVKDRLVPAVYTRSLLYFISGVLEDDADHPVAGLARHASGTEPYDDEKLIKIASWLKQQDEDRLVLSVSGPADSGLASASQTHGGFDDDVETRKSLKDIIAA